jgi:hypothetical protein
LPSRLGLVCAIVAACASPSPVPSAPDPPRIVLPEPGRPYTAADLLAVLRAGPGSESPAALFQREVGDALAAAVWTFDGRPYQSLSAEASCGPSRCEISVQGVPDSSEEARIDHYIFDLDLKTLGLTRTYAGLGAFPADLRPRLDEIARAGLPIERLKGLSFRSAMWLPPPEFGRFELTYDEGGLEGSRALRVVVDARLRLVIQAQDFTR